MTRLLSMLISFSMMWVFTTIHAEAPVSESEQQELTVIKTEWSVEEAKRLVDFYADKYSVSRSVLHTVVECESGYNTEAYNGSDIHKDAQGNVLSVGSKGIAQFSIGTFNSYKPVKDYDDPNNPDQALDTMAYMFSIGEQRHWSCYKQFFKI